MNVPCAVSFVSMRRIPSIDIARGLVMIIMALDHTRDYMDDWSLTHNPTNLDVTTPLEFFTRWITHFCAPTFVFLAGTSIAIQLSRSEDRHATRSWILRRGLILILLEFTIVNFGLTFDPKFRLQLLEVIGTIGAGMVLLSFLSRLPYRWLVALTALIFFGHDLLPIPAAMSMPASNPSLTYTIVRSVGWSLGAFQPGTDRMIAIAYPIIPWFGIMLAGFVAGRWFQQPAPASRRRFFLAGAIALVLFVILRFLNGYGDPSPMSTQKTPLFTLLSFLNVTKYPVSLLFSLMTIGVLCLLLAAFQSGSGQRTDPTQSTHTDQPNQPTRLTAAKRIVLLFGRTPLFYFIVHIYIIHLIMLITLFLQGYSLSQLEFGVFKFGHPKAGGGLPTWSIYPIWFAVVALMYPLCRWYSRHKSAHPEKAWLRYF